MVYWLEEICVVGSNINIFKGNITVLMERHN